MKYVAEYNSRFRILKGGKISLVVSALVAGSTMSFASPTGGAVTSGSATINQNGSVTTINQSTNKASINWNSFNIAPSETVNFVQPSAQSVTLNRVIGTTPSLIQGAMNANGQVFLINPNGVLFANGSQINVGGLVASTLNITDANFQTGNYIFEGNSQNSIINMGTITTAQGGYVAMMGKSVANEGTIVATMGNVQLASGEKISLNLNGNSLVKLTIDQGTLNALVENKGIIKADGGQVYLTTQALNTILDGMVNNTGIIEAQTLNDVTGKVVLFAHGGTANVGGTIKAEGGFVETSGHAVNILDSAVVTTKAVNGKNGSWLIDPYDFTIASSGGNITGAALSTALASNDVTIQTATDGTNCTNVTCTAGTTGTNGDIYVNDSVTWTSGQTLTLDAYRNIYINSTLDASGGSGGKVALYYGQGAVESGNTATYGFGLSSSGFSGKINLQAGSNFSTKLGSDGSLVNYTAITSLGNAGSTSGTNLQGINGDLSGNYVLGTDIDASSTSSWNSNSGFLPIGDSSAAFYGKFDGLGHTVDRLTINNSAGSYQGLFGTIGNTSFISNIGLTDVNINGGVNLGALVGANISGIIQYCYSTGSVTGASNGVGGLVGANKTGGFIIASYSTATVNGNSYVGGLAGVNNGANVSNSYATGSVHSSGNSIGGLVGYNLSSAKISNSYAYGNISTTANNSGGLVGYNTTGATIKNSYSVGTVIGGTAVGGLVGNNTAGSNAITNSFWDTQTSNKSTSSGGIGKTTNEMKTLATFQNAGWSIFGNDGLYPTFSTVNSTTWAMNSPSATSVLYNLSDIATGYTYTGTALSLNTPWNAATIFGSNYSSWTAGTDYKFVYGGNDVTGFTNAGTYSGISVDILKSGYAASASGNSNGSLTIAKADATVTANSDTKTYNAQAQSVSGFSASGLVNGETESVLSGVSTTGGSGTNAGEYTLSASGTDGNYNLTFMDGKLTIVNTLAPSPSTPTQSVERPDVNKIVTTIMNSMAITPPAPIIVAPRQVPQQTPAYTKTKELLQIIMPKSDTHKGSYNLVGTTDGNTPMQTVRMEDLQKASGAQGGVSEIRVALANDSLVSLVNGGLNLPTGVSQEFYVVDNNTNQAN